MSTQNKTIELALQGGGAHGALTWGVLDRLLDEPRLRIEGVSGTSAGAMNAAVLADGLDQGGRGAAQQALERFWRAVSDAALASPIQRSWWDRLNGNWSLENSPAYLLLDQMTRVLSPYQFNPMSINPLREIVEAHIDMRRVNRCTAIQVFVTATNVRTGRAHVFRQPGLSVDALMASAALPFMFQAVEVDGEAYWDGGFTGNPALFPLVDECAARDLMLVQINPFQRADVPQTSRGIINRLNEINFNASLIKELHAIHLLKQAIDAAGAEDERYRDMRIHSINCDEDLIDLEASSKLNAEWAYLQHLRDLGRARADRWLHDHWDDLGERQTFSPSWLNQEMLRPMREPVRKPGRRRS